MINRRCFRAPALLVGIFASTIPFAETSSAAPLPLGSNEWTTLYATFDRDTHAGQARSNPYSAGSSTEIVSGGMVGSALHPKDRLADLVYSGEGNIPGPVGTIRLFVKSPNGVNVWNDGKEYWLAVAERENPVWTGTPAELAKQPGFSLLLYKNTKNEISFGLDNTSGQWLRDANAKLPEDPLPTSVRFDASRLTPGEWHEIIISWDAPQRKFWLRVDDNQVEGQIPASFTAGTFTYLMLTTHPNMYTDRQGTFPGLMDELLVSDRSLPQWLGANSPKTATREEAPAPNWPRSSAVLFKQEPLATYESQLRTHLDTQARNRNASGGWAFAYAYPSGMHFLSTKVRAPYSPHFYNNAKDGTSTLAALRYAMAYEALGDEKYLEIAKDIGASLIKGQQAGGWWPYWWTETPNGIVPYAPERAPIEDHTQTGPIFLLMYLHRLTGQEEYSRAAQKGLDFLIKAQNPNGSWSHHYNVEKQVGESSIREINAGEFNDYTTTEPMAAMLLAYRLTGQQRFLDSYMKAANWILSAFIDKSATGGAVGWAQQYDAQNKPIPARHFEPIATENFASGMAAKEMMNAYRLTGDAKYLEPVRKWTAWMKTLGTKYAFYHDIETGRPIVAEARKVYFLDDPAQAAAHKAAVERTGRPYAGTMHERKDWINIGNYITLAERIGIEKPQPLEHAMPTREQIETESKARAATLASWAPTFDWERGAYAVGMAGTPGPRIGVGSVRVVAALWVLARERALRGDVPLSHPLLRMPYDLEPVAVVAPHLNLYTRLVTPN